MTKGRKIAIGIVIFIIIFIISLFCNSITVYGIC